MENSEIIGKAMAFESICICLKAYDPALADMLARVVLQKGLPDLPFNATEHDMAAVRRGWHSSVLSLVKKH